MLTEQQKIEMLSEIKGFEGNIAELNRKKEELYSNNKEKVDFRTKQRNISSALLIASLLCFAIGLIGLLFFDGLAMILTPIIGGVVGIVFIVLRIKPEKADKALSAELAEYDSEVSKLDAEIVKNQAEIFTINAKLERDATERKYEKYLSNHICIYVGRSSTMKDQPKEKSDYYSDPTEVAVFIDGIEYGSVSSPFAAFEVSPGPHVVKIQAYDNFSGNVDRYAESKSQQVKVTEDSSVYMFYHWSFYNSSKGLADVLYLNTYGDIHSFLNDTHKK